MIRILYITRAKLSLSRAHTQNVVKTAEYLNQQGTIKVAVFSSAAESKRPEEIFDAKGVKLRYVLDIAPRKRSLIAALFRKKGDFDLLYFRDPVLWCVGVIARFLLRKKVIFEVHGSHEWRFLRLFWRLSVTSANGLIFITDRLKRFYHPGKPAIVVHTNGVNLADFETLPEKSMLRRELSLPEEKTIILYAGSFLWHSMDTLVSLSRLLAASVVLVVVGVKETEAEVLLRLNLSNMIVIKRVLPKNIPRYLLSADILVNPLTITYPGSISSKLYEYLASARPIVSSRGGANSEILENGKNAIIVDPPTAENFTKAIERIMKDENLRRSLSQNAFESAKKYTWQKRAEAIAHFLTTL